MLTIHISLVQICSLNRKTLGFWVQLDYCNSVFFPSQCISEQPLSHILHPCLSIWAIFLSVWLHRNTYYSKNIAPSRLSSSICKWPFTSCESIDQFFLSANTLGCQNSARDAIFLLLFAAKVGRCMAGRHAGEMCDQSCFCCPDSLICSTPHHVPPSSHMEPPAE